MSTTATTPTIREQDLDRWLLITADPPTHITLAIHLMYYCGLRVGETIQLTWSDLVRDNLPLNAIALTGDMCKYGHGRTLPIPGKLANHIVDVWEGHARPRGITISHYATAPNRKSRNCSARTLQRAVRRYGHQLGYPNLTPHVLRHTFATRLLAVSNIVTVQQALGHRRITTTQRYTHPTSDDMRTAMESL